uniref:START domain-containing protein 10 n=1 Tax=Oryctolagus cuniculus TaxID=9986 RepID=A0A5F9DL95_RABIT
MAGAHMLGPSSTAFPRCTSRELHWKWSSRDKNSTPVGCWCRRRWPYLLHTALAPCLLCFCRMECRDVPAETLYDVLHDIEYRKKWDSNVIETFDIARLTVNADVGYYSWRCPKPLKNRDVITLRSWLPMGTDYIIMNYSVKHPKYPPRKDLVRAVSIQTGYLIQSTGPKSCVITYLAQVDPKGSLPKWVVNKSSQFLAPKAMKKMYKACVKYPEWKQKHQPHFKPWLHPEQSPLPSLALSELSVQHADSLENIDESAVAESREERASGGTGLGPRRVLRPCWTQPQ